MRIGPCLVLLCTGSWPGFTQSVPRVGQWDRFETSLENRRQYSDPFTAVNLDATFTKPDGSQTRFWGFYDGGAVWRLRFMPDQLGLWKYEARFSDGSPGAQGSFECVQAGIPGLIHKDETNPRWFGFKGGKHVLIRSFHAHGLMSPDLSHEKRKAFLDWAQKQAYNTFSVSNVIARDAWPIDLDRLRRTEAILSDLSTRGIMVHPFQGFFHGGSELSPATPAEQELFIRYVLARLGVYWNLLLNASGPEPNLRNIIKPPEVERLGATIHRFDLFQHLLGVHNKDGNDPYRNAAWTSYATLQHEIADLTKLGDYYLSNHTGDKPVYAHEMCWPGNTLQFDKEPVKTCTMERLRGQMWVAMMSQTAFNTGDMNGRSNSGFSGSTDLADKVQDRHDLPKMIWDFMEKLPFHRMNPRQDLVSAGFALVEPGGPISSIFPKAGK